MPKSGYKRYWERKKALQSSTFEKMWIAIIKKEKKLPTVEEVKEIYGRRNLSKKQKDILLNLWRVRHFENKRLKIYRL